MVIPSFFVSVILPNLILNREGAQPQLRAITASNRRGLFMATLPYKIGITAAMASAVISIPMIFELNTVLWFNEVYVTSGKLLTCQ